VFVKRLALEGQAGFWLTAGGWFPTLVQISATTMAEAALHLQLKSVSPCLLVDDVVKSAEYYRDVLGFISIVIGVSRRVL
jgi:hypothetical protein